MRNSIVITRIKEAITLTNLSVALGVLAIICFCIFGTLASMAKFKDSIIIYSLFHYLPYGLIGISIPISIYHLLLIGRYRILQRSIIAIVSGSGIGSVLITLSIGIWQGTSIGFFMSVFLTMIIWFSMPFLFRVNLKKFLSHLQHS